MKIVIRYESGVEELVCESISKYHGLMFVSLMNANFATVYRKEKYKLVDHGYQIKADDLEGQMSIFD